MFHNSRRHKKILFFHDMILVVWKSVKMHKNTCFKTREFKKKIFFQNMCFIAFVCTYSQTIRIKLGNFFFDVSNGETRVLMHLRILPDHQKHRLKKILFNIGTDHQNQGLTKDIFIVWSGLRYFSTSGVVKNVV